MSLEKRQLGGKEKKIKRKAWRELMQEELVERVKSISDDDILDTSMRKYDPAISLAVTQIKFVLFGGKRKGRSAILYGNIYKGTDMMYSELEENFAVIGEANVELCRHPIRDVREEVLSEVQYFKFPISKKMNLKIQQWVPDLLSHVSECLAIDIAGLYGMSLCYALYDEDTISEDYRLIFKTHVEQFRHKVEGKSYKLQILLNHMKNEEGVTT